MPVFRAGQRGGWERTANTFNQTETNVESPLLT